MCLLLLDYYIHSELIHRIYCVNALQTLVEELLTFSVHRDILQAGAIMAALFDDKPLVAGINEDYDEHTTGHFMPAEKAQLRLMTASPNHAARMHPALTHIGLTSHRIFCKYFGVPPNYGFSSSALAHISDYRQNMAFCIRR